MSLLTELYNAFFLVAANCIVAGIEFGDGRWFFAVCHCAISLWVMEICYETLKLMGGFDNE